MTTKKCVRCGVTKAALAENFRSSKSTADKFHAWCRDCCRAYDKERGAARRTHSKPGRPPRQLVNEQLRCGRCGIPKPLESFAKDSRNVLGVQNRCRDCQAVLDAQQYEDPAERTKRIEAARKWNSENLDRHHESKHASDKRRRPQINEYFAKKRREDIQYRLGQRLRIRLISAIRRGMYNEAAQRGASAVRDLGCTIGELMVHLEKQWKPGMSWDNYGDWHIDHVRPLSSFDLTDPVECKAACNFTNLQPLWAEENLTKGDKTDS